ncbi:MAG: hypothetical protein COA79_10575 [Planctomycetota bacterium]|nr:MAG: hypothetical protein COA79_10575 [Planctomycetota bacterium]
MIRKMLSPLPLFLTILVTFGALYYFKTYLPQFQVTQGYVISYSDEKLAPADNFAIYELNDAISESLEKLHAEQNLILKYFLENEYPPHFYHSKSVLERDKEKKELIGAITYPSTSIKSSKVIRAMVNTLNKDFQNKIVENLNEKKILEEKDIKDLKRKIANANAVIEMQPEIKDTKEAEPKEKKPKETESKEKQTKSKITISQLPLEATSSLKKFKVYKDKKMTRLKEIEELLKNIPEPGHAKLNLLTSNLQKSYMLEEHRLNLNIKFGPQKDKKVISNYITQKKNVLTKLRFENMRLRDESHFLKGQQDQALRAQKFSLLQEQKNLKDTISALNELQQSIFKRNQQTYTTTDIEDQNQGTKKPSDSKITSSNQANRINKTSVHDMMKTMEKHNKSLITINAAIKYLKKPPLKVTYKKPIVVNNPFYNNWYILAHLLLTVMSISVVTGLFLGKKLNISKGEVAADILDTQLLGVIPDIPNNGLENAKHKRFTDAIDKITSELSTLINEKNLKTISIISPKDHEGKTQLTGMISLSYNLNQKMKVIALDMTMKGTKIADFLQLKTKMLPTDDGVISYFKELNEKKEINETENNQWLAKLVKPCIKNGIFAISPGKGPFDDEGIVNTKSINTMYNGLSKYVDLILVNTPSINSNNQKITLNVAENSDGNILLLKKGSYTKNDLLELKNTISAIPILGIVFK